ncbi:MAG: prepilin-type N-terminal cleavage/methylation domain-containing protein [Planctomycetes bacterium]|nr:prepilin-type N-terminal cleavage/methylation domain-containing protein [Planctomycetota bacterium]
MTEPIDKKCRDLHLPQEGFTLLELLVVLVVLSVATGLGGGLYVGTYQKLLVTRAARGIYTMAQYARVAAIEKQASMRMVFDKEQKRVWLETTQFNLRSETSEQIVVSNPFCRPVQLAPQVDLEAVLVQARRRGGDSESGARQTLTFYPDGTADTAAIQIGNGVTHYSIGISPSTGKARFVKGEAKDLGSTTIDLDAQ